MIQVVDTIFKGLGPINFGKECVTVTTGFERIAQFTLDQTQMALQDSTAVSDEVGCNLSDLIIINMTTPEGEPDGITKHHSMLVSIDSGSQSQVFRKVGPDSYKLISLR